MLAQLDRTGEDQVSLTDPDGRAMAAHTKVGVGYNIQVAVDAKNKLIVEQAVTNQVVDTGLLTQTAEPAREVLGVETIDVAVDRGYFKIEDIGNPKACRACPLSARCTNDARSVFRLENEDVLDRMAERLKARPAILDRRREVVERPFGSIKQWVYQGAFLMRGLANVRAEFSLTALAYNLRRALNILGVEAMTAAVAA